MQYKPTRSLCATVAIVATLALGSTPAVAQETAAAAPAPVVAVPPPVAAAPTVAVPPVTIQPTAPQPEASAAAEPARTEPAPKRAATPRRAAAAPAASAPATGAPAAVAPVDTAPAVPTAAPAEAALQAPLDTAAPAPVAQAPAPAAEADGGGLTGEEASFLALLAAIGLGGVAFLAMGRRRRRMASEVGVEDYAPGLAPELATARLPEPAVLTETPVRADPVYDVTDHPAQPATASAAMAATRSTPAASFMGSGPVPDGDDRQDLIDRMVAAEPDEANPFTSPKARRRRARLILQARENGQPDDAAKPFDWRSYEPSRRREPSELTPA